MAQQKFVNEDRIVFYQPELNRSTYSITKSDVIQRK